VNKIHMQHELMYPEIVKYDDALSSTNIDLFILSDDYDDIIITCEDLWES